MTSRTKLAAITLLAACASPPPQQARSPEATTSWEEGAYEYLPPLKGQSINADGRFVFLYGPVDGSGPMTGEAGTYTVAGDTVTNTVRYSTDAERVGQVFRWMVRSVSADTMTFVTMGAEGQVTGEGRSVRVR